MDIKGLRERFKTDSEERARAIAAAANKKERWQGRAIISALKELCRIAEPKENKGLSTRTDPIILADDGEYRVQAVITPFDAFDNPSKYDSATKFMVTYTDRSHDGQDSSSPIDDFIDGSIPSEHDYAWQTIAMLQQAAADAGLNPKLQEDFTKVS